VVPFLILAGMVVGPHMPKLGIVDLRFIQSAPLIEFMGRLGILFLLFYLGLEFSLGRLIKAGRLIAVGGTIYIALNFGLGLGNDDDIGGFAQPSSQFPGSVPCSVKEIGDGPPRKSRRHKVRTCLFPSSKGC
jgi:Kef-type K+ transport system membrane component KefB